MKTYWGSGGIIPLILDLGSRWRWVVSFKTQPLYFRGKSLRYLLDRTLGGSQSRPKPGGHTDWAIPARTVAMKLLHITKHETCDAGNSRQQKVVFGVLYHW